MEKQVKCQTPQSLGISPLAPQSCKFSINNREKNTDLGWWGQEGILGGHGICISS